MRLGLPRTRSQSLPTNLSLLACLDNVLSADDTLKVIIITSVTSCIAPHRLPSLDPRLLPLETFDIRSIRIVLLLHQQRRPSFAARLRSVWLDS